jgi:hypothetical protein
MQDRVAVDDVERVVRERQRLGLGADRLDVEAEPRRRLRQRVEHALRDVSRDGRAHDARLHEVEREVAGAGADLEAALVHPDRLAERLAQLAGHLLAAGLLVGDPPLRVVRLRGHVVVARVDVLDRLCRGGGRHRRGDYIRDN